MAAIMLFTRAMIYFYGGRCVSNTTAQGSVMQRGIVGLVIALLSLSGSLPSPMLMYVALPNLLSAFYTQMCVKRHYLEERDDEWNLKEEMLWAFWLVGEE